MKQFWCLHCQRATVAEVMPEHCPTPGCSGAAEIDLHEVGVADGLLDPWPSHWPNKLEEGRVYPLYQ